MRAKFYQAKEMTTGCKVLIIMMYWVCNINRSNMCKNNMTKREEGEHSYIGIMCLYISEIKLA